MSGGTTLLRGPVPVSPVLLLLLLQHGGIGGVILSSGAVMSVTHRTSMASHVYLYLSAVAPPTILVTGPCTPHVASLADVSTAGFSQTCSA